MRFFTPFLRPFLRFSLHFEYQVGAFGPLREAREGQGGSRNAFGAQREAQEGQGGSRNDRFVVEHHFCDVEYHFGDLASLVGFFL